MDDSDQYIIFGIGDKRYALNIKDISEIHRLNQIYLTPFPKAERDIEGIMNLRGEVVPVVNLKVRLRFESAKTSRGARVLIVKKDRKTIGFIVDQIYEVKEVLNEHIIEAPQDIKEEYEYIINLISEEHNVVSIIDILKILNLREEIR